MEEEGVVKSNGLGNTVSLFCACVYDQSVLSAFISWWGEIEIGNTRTGVCIWKPDPLENMWNGIWRARVLRLCRETQSDKAFTALQQGDCSHRLPLGTSDCVEMRSAALLMFMLSMYATCSWFGFKCVLFFPQWTVISRRAQKLMFSINQTNKSTFKSMY